MGIKAGTFLPRRKMLGEELQRGCETISISMRFYRANIYVIRRSRDASVPCWSQIPFPHYAEIQWNPVSFRFIRGTLRTSLRSICLLRDSIVLPPSMKPILLFRYRGMRASMPLISRIMISATNVSGIVNIPIEFFSYRSNRPDSDRFKSSLERKRERERKSFFISQRSEEIRWNVFILRIIWMDMYIYTLWKYKVSTIIFFYLNKIEQVIILF